MRYEIHPTVGVARLGDSEESFYLAPDAIGGLPTECDANGNAIVHGGEPKVTERFKDSAGRVRRQAARFRILAFDSGDPDDPGRELTLDDDGVRSIEWTVHLANKKAAWYEAQDLDGNLMLGEDNSYEARGVPLRNARITERAERQRLITDPGPRTVSGVSAVAEVSRDTIPPDYPHGSFPPPDLGPFPIDSLGTLMTDRAGRLLVLGGYGRACGNTIIGTFAGADSWYDDVSDGPVTCRLTLAGGEEVELSAWALIGSPKFAPELRNIVTLADVMLDVGVRFMGLMPELFDTSRWPESGGWNPDYEASFERDIAPIMERPGDYIWVANVPSMVAFSYPRFDVRDASDENRPRREEYLSYFRRPGDSELGAEHEVLFGAQGIPLMPLNAGTNPVTNDNLDKFMSLTITQYTLLRQWARGRFTVGGAPPVPGVHALDEASVGNCVGHPMAPGIEVSWSMRNPAVYERPFVIRHRFGPDHYREHGLDPGRDEADTRNPDMGCEPGDLTKRMSPPWQADFYDCSQQYTNFTDPTFNQAPITNIPPPPLYYTYWWPPQSPWNVISGDLTIEEQEASGVAAGYQVPFARGADNIARLVVAWKYMGFIVNQNTSDSRDAYPYFVERERNHERFVVSSVAVGAPINQLAANGIYPTQDNAFHPVWYLKDQGDTAQRRTL